MITIIFESHSTTEDNEAKLAAGWYDVALSKLGEEQAVQLGERYKDQKFDAIFCSDLQRSYKTAQLAFGNKYPIIKDKRLRECNYGDLNRASKKEVKALKEEAITKPFPNGESYQDTSETHESFPIRPCKELRWQDRYDYWASRHTVRLGGMGQRCAAQ